MKRTLFLVALLAFSIAVFIYWGNSLKLAEAPSKIVQTEKILTEARKIAAETVVTAKEIKEKLHYTPPLVAEKGRPISISFPALTRLGIFTWTNIQRTANSKYPKLNEDADLNIIAERRLDDMFKEQYFAHDSPSGEDASGIAEEIGYEYTSIGENIALGNFKNDQELVQGWMDSPGHRANILNPKFTRIGIAVKRGIWQGNETWIAVQIFSKPLSACPAVDDNLKSAIDNNRVIIDNLIVEANAASNRLKAETPKTKQEIEEYNKKVKEYNNLALKINSLIAKTKQMISAYNRQVEIFNSCAGG